MIGIKNIENDKICDIKEININERNKNCIYFHIL